MTFLEELSRNQILWTALAAWALAQFIKVPLEFIEHRRWNWGLWFSSGGMPSSHSALVVSTMLSIGLLEGFDTPAFAIATAIAMVIVYDAAGVRREAGRHAERINILINELISGHPVNEKQLKEVIGHTPTEVVMGVILGIVTAVGSYLFF